MKTTVIVEDGRPVIVEEGAEAPADQGGAEPSADAPIDAGAAPVDRAGETGAPSPNGSADGGPPPAWLIAAIARAGGMTEPAPAGDGDVDAGAGPA